MALFRKASASLRGKISGNKELLHFILSQKTTKDAQKNWIRAQSEMMEYLAKWSDAEQNPVFRDTVARMLELNKCWNEAQEMFTSTIREYRKAFEGIMLELKDLHTAEKNKAKFEKNEKTLLKDIHRMEEKGEDTSSMESKLRQARGLRETAELEVRQCYVDTENFKQHVLKESLIFMSEGYVKMLEKGVAIFKAQRQIAQLVPEEAPHVASPPVIFVPPIMDCERIMATAHEQVQAVEASYQRPIGRALSRRVSTRPSLDSLDAGEKREGKRGGGTRLEPIRSGPRSGSHDNLDQSEDEIENWDDDDEAFEDNEGEGDYIPSKNRYENLSPKQNPQSSDLGLSSHLAGNPNNMKHGGGGGGGGGGRNSSSHPSEDKDPIYSDVAAPRKATNPPGRPQGQKIYTTPDGKEAIYATPYDEEPA